MRRKWRRRREEEKEEAGRPNSCDAGRRPARLVPEFQTTEERHERVIVFV